MKKKKCEFCGKPAAKQFCSDDCKTKHEGNQKALNTLGAFMGALRKSGLIKAPEKA